jgi:hypothetical protein
MFAFSKKTNQRDNNTSLPDETRPAPMSLEERKAFRREMLYQAIRHSMKSLEVVSSMYRFKVINVDSRHHRFLAMIEVTSTFEARKGGIPQAFSQIEALIKAKAFERFDLILEGIFWRVSESEKAFQRRVREGESAAEASSSLAASQQHAHKSAGGTEQRLARRQFPAVPNEERQAFMEALVKGGHLPEVQGGDALYETDRAPLDDKRISGGTQYGMLE